MKYLKRFEDLSANDYRSDDPISRLQMMELIYNTIMENEDSDTVNISDITDRELDMESAEIKLTYKGVPFRLTIEKAEPPIQEGVGGGGGCSAGNSVSSSAPGSPDAPALPRKATVKRIKKFGKFSGVNKSTKSSGGRNALSGKIATHE